MDAIDSGQITSFFTAAVVLTVLASLAVLHTYRRTVQSYMQRTPVSADARRRPREPSIAAPNPGDGVVAARSLLRCRIVTAYVLAGLVCSAIASTLLLKLTRDAVVTPFHVVMVTYVFAWPIAPSLATLLHRGRLGTIGLMAVHALTGALLVLGWSCVSRFMLGKSDVEPVGNVVKYTIMLIAAAGPPCAISVVLTGGAHMRLVSPLVFCGVLVFSLASLLLERAFVHAFDNVTLRPHLLGFGRTPLFLLASLPVGYVCWRVQRWLGAMYQAKQFSDKQFSADTWWFIALFFFSIELAREVGTPGYAALAVFVIYRGVVQVILKCWPVSNTEPTPKVLLVLRTFGAPRSATRLFDGISERWRYAGSVQLIGAPDLALRTIDPGDILSFLTGHFESQFVHDGGDLMRRLPVLDNRRDPDGRFRVNDFYCFDSSWQQTVEALLVRSDVVLMDVRGLSATNRGCLFELGKLVEHRRIERTVLVVDATTDEQLLHSTLKAASAAIGAPYALEPRIMRTVAASSGELDRLCSSLASLSNLPAPASVAL